MYCTCGHERDDHRSGRGYCHRCDGTGGPGDCRRFRLAENETDEHRDFAEEAFNKQLLREA